MTRRLRPYPEIRGTSLASIPALPTDWGLVRLKQLLASPLQYGANESADHDDRTQPRFIRITDINSKGGLHDDTFRSLPEHVAAPYILADKDLLLARSGATVGKSFMYSASWGRACFAGYLIRARVARARLLPEWLNYFCQTGEYWDYVAGAQIQATIQNVSAERYGGLAVPVPSLDEQTQIAKFLDYETAKIDQLIDKQQQLIALLKEKRQAVISHAVTKGLNPDAPMKDSGVEWLGQVPAHWEVGQLRRWIRQMEQGKSPECDNRAADPGEWGVLKTGCVNGGVFHPEENKTLPRHISPFPQYEVRASDVLMSRASGSPELIGSVALVAGVRSRLLLSDKIFRIHLEPSFAPPFFTYLMRSSYMRTLIVRAISGAEGMANNITKTAIVAFKAAAPPFEEQDQIARHLVKRTARLDRLCEAAAAMLEVLAERRTALISAAVTGKIDVRNWQPPEGEATPEVA